MMMNPAIQPMLDGPSGSLTRGTPISLTSGSTASPFK